MQFKLITALLASSALSVFAAPAADINDNGAIAARDDQVKDLDDWSDKRAAAADWNDRWDHDKRAADWDDEFEWDDKRDVETLSKRAEQAAQIYADPRFYGGRQFRNRQFFPNQIYAPNQVFHGGRLQRCWGGRCW